MPTSPRGPEQTPGKQSGSCAALDAALRLALRVSGASHAAIYDARVDAVRVALGPASAAQDSQRMPPAELLAWHRAASASPTGPLRADTQRSTADAARALPAWFYAGWPLPGCGDSVIGCLAVWSSQPLNLDDASCGQLCDLALLATSSLLIAGLAETHPPDTLQAEQRQRLLASALESFPGAVMISDPQGQVLISNSRWRRVVSGVMGAELDTKPVLWPTVVRRMVQAGYYPDAVGREEAFVAWRLALPNAAPQTHEIRIWQDRWMELTDRVLADGSVLHLIVETTQRKQYELALAESERRLKLSEARLQSVLVAIPDLWFVLDPDGNYLECAGPDHPMLARPFNELRGRNVIATTPGAAGRGLAAALRALQRTEQPQRLEYELPMPDGRSRTFEARLTPMPSGHVLLLTRDLTELRELRRDVALMESVLEAESSLPLVLLDARLPGRPVIYANPAFERLTSAPRRAAIGGDWKHLVGADEYGLTELEQAMASGRRTEITTERARAEGAIVFEWRLSPVHDAWGEVTHFILVLGDVTDRVRAAERLRVSEELYRSVAAAVSDGLIVVDLGGRVTAVNPAACRMLGVAHDELIGRREPLPFSLLDTQLRSVARERLPVHRVLKGGPSVVDETWVVRRADDGLCWISLSCHPLRLGPEQPPFSVVATLRDVTEARQAAEALKLSEERWSFALEGAEHGVWDWDLTTGRCYFSRRWRDIMGYSEGTDPGEHGPAVSARMHPDDAPGAREALSRHTDGKTQVYQAEYRICLPDGGLRWVQDRGKVVARLPDERPARMVGTLSDVTRQKEAEQALRDKQAAEVASLAKTEFLSRMSHEIRTPLNAVLGFAQLLQLEPEADTGARLTYVEHILRAGQHLLSLVNDVLDLQQVEQGRIDLAPQPLRLDEIVEGCIELLAPRADAAGLRFVRRLEPGLVVLADPRRLQQVLLNVASNAVKYNRPGGSVRWILEAQDASELTLAVEDDGPGMTADQLARLFQPFERLGRETTNVEGSGLGLIIARRLVREMGGDLEVHSRPGVGTRVSFRVPRAPAVPPDDALPADVPPVPAACPMHTPLTPAAPARRLRLLYVEDNRINALLFEQAMQMKPEVDLRIAEDGQQALECVVGWLPDVLVIDANLAGMTGYEALQMLRSVQGLEQQPAYMCSADAMPEDIDRALRSGFVGYWVKPIDVRQVMLELDRWMAVAVGTAPAGDDGRLPGQSGP